MARLKEKVAIVVVSGTLATGLFAAVEPPSHSDPAQRNAQQAQQQLENASDAQESANEQLRRDGEAHMDAENARELIPGEHRPVELPRLRIGDLP